MSKPYVGAVVHYRDIFTGASDPQAAIIVRVHDDRWVSLKIFSGGGGERYASHVELGVGWDFIVPPIETPTLNASYWAGGL